MATSPTVIVNVSGARGPTGPASGPLAPGSVGASEISNSGTEQANIRTKLNVPQFSDLIASNVGKSGGGTVQDFISSPEFTNLSISGVITVAASYVATRAVGTAPSGSSTPQQWITTGIGNGDGTTTLYAEKRSITVSGGNSMLAVRNQYLGTDVETTGGTISAAFGTHTYVWMKGAGSIANVRGVESHFRLDGTGGVTGTAVMFNVPTITIGGSGTINQAVGYQCGEIAHNQVGQAIGFDCANFSSNPSNGLRAAFRSQMNSGTNRWNLYLSGTADNFIEGKVRWGSTALAANNGKVVSITNVGPGSSSGIAIQEWVQCAGTGGGTRYIPLFG